MPSNFVFNWWYHFILWWYSCFFLYNVTMWFIWFCFLYWASDRTKYIQNQDTCFLQWLQPIKLDIFGLFWRQNLSSNQVSWLNVCEIYSWVFTYLGYCYFCQYCLFTTEALRKNDNISDSNLLDSNRFHLEGLQACKSFSTIGRALCVGTLM